MDVRNIESYFNEILILLILAEADSTVEQTRERLRLLSNGKIDLSVKHIGVIFLKLRNQKLIIKTKNSEHRITDKGIDVVRKIKSVNDRYSDAVNCVLSNNADKNNRDFEKAFSEFLDKSEIDEAKDVFFGVMRKAFASGWNNSGKNLSAKKVFDITSVKNSNGK